MLNTASPEVFAARVRRLDAVSLKLTPAQPFHPCMWVPFRKVAGPVALSGALSACVGSAPAQPLYLETQDGPPALAELHGEIEYVDGAKVSGGKFALLPGCHVVRPPTAWGSSSPQDAVWATLPVMHLAILMQADHRYKVAIGGGHMDGTGSGSVRVEAVEINPRGDTVKTFVPLEGAGQMEACEREAAASMQEPPPAR